MTEDAPRPRPSRPAFGGAAGWRLGPAVLATALIAAGFAIVFRGTLAAVTSALGGKDLVSMITAAPRWERALLPALGGLGAGLALFAAIRLREGSGVGFVMEAIVLGRVRIPLARSALLAVASWCAIAGGNSLGREGPLIQFGAAAGEAARRGFRLDNASARLVLAAGVAAGFAAAYNAPIAATLFLVEVVTGVLVLEAIVPVLLAVVIATVVTRHAIGGTPLYGLHDFGSPPPLELLAFAGLGLVMAPLAVGFLRWLAIVERWWRRVPIPWRPALGGVLCGGLVCAFPWVAGNGFEPLTLLFDGRLAVGVVLWLFVLKPLATGIAVGSSNPGGAFTPTLLIGGCAGTIYALGLHGVFGTNFGVSGAYALVGMAAALAATTHAPLTAAVLACELSGDFGLVLPLLATTAISSAVARRLYMDSVYTAELTRRGVRWRLTLDGRRVIENPKPTADAVE